MAPRGKGLIWDKTSLEGRIPTKLIKLISLINFFLKFVSFIYIATLAYFFGDNNKLVTNSFGQFDKYLTPFSCLVVVSLP